jgi:NifB/MoaA-like Fe-S oxidoreductase
MKRKAKEKKAKETGLLSEIHQIANDNDIKIHSVTRHKNQCPICETPNITLKLKFKVPTGILNKIQSYRLNDNVIVTINLHVLSEMDEIRSIWMRNSISTKELTNLSKFAESIRKIMIDH